jgi:hypothetical protein
MGLPEHPDETVEKCFSPGNIAAAGKQEKTSGGVTAVFG